MHSHESGTSCPSFSASYTRYLKGKAADQAICKNLGYSILEEPEDRSSERGNDYESEPERQHSENYSASEDKLEEDDLIPHPSLHSLVFEAMLR